MSAFSQNINILLQFTIYCKTSNRSINIENFTSVSVIGKVQKIIYLKRVRIEGRGRYIHIQKSNIFENTSVSREPTKQVVLSNCNYYTADAFFKGVGYTSP